MPVRFSEPASVGFVGARSIGKAVSKIAKSVVKFKKPPPKKQIAVKQITQTDVFRPRGRAPMMTQGPSIEGIPIIPQIPIKPSRVPASTPINIGFGPAPGGAIRQAGVAIGRLLLRSPGTRQAAEKIAGRATTLKPFGRGPTLGQAAAFTGGVIAAETILQAGEKFLDYAAAPFQAAQVSIPSPQRGVATMQHGTGRSLQTLPGVGGMLPPGTTIVKTWHTGTAAFARLADGRMAVQRKDGTIKVWRPQKHIVIPRNPRVGTLIRADKRLQRLTTGLRKVVDRGRTRRKA